MSRVFPTSWIFDICPSLPCLRGVTPVAYPQSRVDSYMYICLTCLRVTPQTRNCYLDPFHRVWLRGGRGGNRSLSRTFYATPFRPGEGGNTGYGSTYLERTYTEACCDLLRRQPGVGYKRGKIPGFVALRKRFSFCCFVAQTSSPQTNQHVSASQVYRKTTQKQAPTNDTRFTIQSTSLIRIYCMLQTRLSPGSRCGSTPLV